MLFETKKKTGKLLQLPVSKIKPSPHQARKVFNKEEIASLAQSIKMNGLLQPISVRKSVSDCYELIAGERRLRACKLAGIEKIPAILYDFEEAQSASLSLLENIQRKDLNPFEQAEGIKEIIEIWDCTQIEAARRLGMAQPTLANKLRLLNLEDAFREFILEQNLTERHARAVLRLDSSLRAAALVRMVKENMNASTADAYVEKLLEKLKQTKKPRKKAMVKDVRIFLNTINHAIKIMTEHGVPATSHKTEGEGFVEYTVRIPTSVNK